LANSNKWPITVEIQPTELLSSWLYRAAQHNGCNVSTLTDYSWPTWRCWATDIDRYLTTAQLNSLSQHSGTSVDKIFESTLASIAIKVNGNIPNKLGIWPWITTLGTRNTKRRGGIAVCPLCLSNEPTPYFSKRGRYAWRTICEIHKVKLIDSCIQCKKPITTYHETASSLPISECFGCSNSLIPKTNKVTYRTQSLFQDRSDTVLANNHGVFHGRSVSVDDWFSCASYYMSLIKYSYSYQSDSLRKFLASAGIENPVIPPLDRGIPFESMTISSRIELTKSLHLFIDLSENEVTEKLIDSGVSQQAFLGARRSQPILVKDISNKLYKRASNRRRVRSKIHLHPVPKKSVLKKLSRLERHLKWLS